jgi:MYXO-CTERM domain-containing protein
MRRTLPAAASIAATLVLCAPPAQAMTLTVGPGKTFAKPCEAIAAAQPGDVIEVDAGVYDGDTCGWSTDNLTVRGVGGLARMNLQGQAPAQKKGVFAISATTATIENFELAGAAISPSDGENGAGIRFQGNNLTVRGCYIHDNQDGILAAPASVDGGVILIEHTELAHNALGDGCNTNGCTHNVYISGGGSLRYDKLVFQYNWSHDIASETPDKGHLLKSRARETDVLYNRITGEMGHESYCIDLSNGGLGVVVGNVIEQGPSPDNFTLLAYGLEGLSNPDSRLFVASNTFVNDASKGTFINVASGGTLTAHNNVFFGPGTPSSTGALSADNLSGTDPLFADAAKYDYHLGAGSPALDKGVDPGKADTFSLTPTMEYVHPVAAVPRLDDGTLDLGAFERGTNQMGTGGAGTGTSSSSGSAASTSAGVGGAGVGGAGAGGSATTGSGGGTTAKGGCSCRAGGEEPAGGAAAAFVMMGALAARRRRSRRARA